MSEQMETKKIVFSPEMREKMKGRLGFDVETPFTFVPKRFLEKDKEGKYVFPKNMWTIYTLKSKNGLDIAKLEDDAGYMSYDSKSGNSKYHMQSGAKRVGTLIDGIIRVKNFYMEDDTFVHFDSVAESWIIYDFEGSLIKTKTKTKTKKLISVMHVSEQQELQEAINERSEISDEDKMGLEL